MKASETYVYVIEEESGGEICTFISKVHIASPTPDNIVHSCKVVDAGDLSVLKMGSAEGKPCKVIHNGNLKEYVGIGWIVEREARISDYYQYPVAV